MLRLLTFLILAGCSFSTLAASSLQWDAPKDSVSADITGGNLDRVLRQVSAATGWQVYIEPETKHTVSAKFTNLRPGEALPLLLGDLNFALLPGTNSRPKLLVFRTAAASATRLLPAVSTNSVASKTNLIGNELIVRLKPGAKIDDIAKQLGAKVAGRIEQAGAYKLQFEDDAAAESAREKLTANTDQVSAVDSNFSIERPDPPAALPGQGGPPMPQLTLKPPPDNGRVIVGLIDTGVQPLGGGLDAFLLKQITLQGDATAASAEPSHGTSMAETILRSLQNITKGSTAVQILPVDVYGANESTSTFDVANGIVQAVNGGAKIVNLSLGSEADSTFLHDTIQEVAKKNVVIFAAAGNEPVTTPFYPAAYPEVTAVTAVDHGTLAPYASRGSFVSLGAPGTSVVQYNNQPFYIVGTSTSAAFTSGIAAGYLDTTKNDTQKMQSFLKGNFGVNLGASTSPATPGK